MRRAQRSMMVGAALIFSLSSSLIAADKKLAGTPNAVVAPIPQQLPQARPIPMGVSIGNTPSAPFAYAGTAGLLVHSLANPTQKFILSNNHVLGAQGPGLCPNSAVPGQTFTVQPGTLDVLLQDLPNPAVVGRVTGFFPLASGLNLIDAALSGTNDSLAKSEILQIGVPNAALGIATPGMLVTKGGRTTGVTSGVVDSVNSTIVVGYGEGCSSYLFIGQTVITPGTFSGSGDSGSAILEASTKTPVGLLFAGNGALTIANQIFWVYALLGVFADGSSPTSAPASVEQLTRVQRSLEATVDSRVSRITEIQARHQNQILAISGIHGIGVGLDAGEMVLKVYGTRLTDAIVRALPQRVDGVRVVFRESGGPFTAR